MRPAFVSRMANRTRDDRGGAMLLVMAWSMLLLVLALVPALVPALAVLGLAAGECVQLWAYSSDGTGQIIAIAAQTTPDRPAVPPAIVTIRQVG